MEALLAAHDKPEAFPPSDAPAVKATIKLDVVDAEEESLGKTIGRYKILEKVGEGGCSVVYVAEQNILVTMHDGVPVETAAFSAWRKPGFMTKRGVCAMSGVSEVFQGSSLFCSSWIYFPRFFLLFFRAPKLAERGGFEPPLFRHFSLGTIANTLENTLEF